MRFAYLVGVFLCCGGANAATLRVEAGGVDGATCGPSPACRSITQAIANALPGDTILVGPGRYGDVNNDGDLSDPGDEWSGDPNVLIRIDKAVRIQSTHGAGTTLIESSSHPSILYREAAVLITGKVTFGAPNAGFTMHARNYLEPGRETDSGVLVQSTQDVRVEGNAATGFKVGFRARNPGVRTITFVSNQGIGNTGSGFLAETSTTAGRITLTQNLAKSNAGTGFAFDTLWEGEYIEAHGTTITATGNVSTANGMGYSVTTIGPLVFQNNTASGNYYNGLETASYDRDAIGEVDTRVRIYTLTGFSALGNGMAGIELYRKTRVNVTGSNFIGNDEFFNGGKNCGIRNGGRGAVKATGNYWGSNTGPGPNKADAVCDFSPGVTTFKPFSTARLPIAQ